jgi:hypothetical protein
LRLRRSLTQKFPKGAPVAFFQSLKNMLQSSAILALASLRL